MKSDRSVSKIARKSSGDASRPSSSGGEKGVAMTPPDYGIGFVDRGMEAAAPVQRVGEPEEEEKMLQGMFDAGAVVQAKAERVPNRTGLPDRLKSGIENLSGYSMDDVRVHYNSSKPAQLNALAYAQASEIHLAPGQEKHLPHEAWHVVQQKQGRVRPTMQMKGVAINDNLGLEYEATQMSEKALQGKVGAGVGLVKGTDPYNSPLQEKAEEPSHENHCICPTCTQAQMESGPVSQVVQRGGNEVMQLVCGKCNSPKHRTTNCPVPKKDIDERKSNAIVFNKAIQEALKKEKKDSKEKPSLTRKQQESANRNESTNSKPTTEKFRKDHVKETPTDATKKAESVAQNRNYGTGNTPGRKKSTLLIMSPDKQKELRVEALRNLKLEDSQVERGHPLSTKQGHNVKVKTLVESIDTDVIIKDDGRRSTDHTGGMRVPEVGLRDGQVHHLEGTEKAEGGEKKKPKTEKKKKKKKKKK